MGNPLLVFWHRIFTAHETSRGSGAAPALLDISIPQSSASIFLVLRRMRVPLIVLITIFAVSVFGLTLIPGQDAWGRPDRMSFFESFYFMSSTATTIGFGEVPHPFTPAQRLWVTVTIYLAVIGWAYAIGSLLALLQDREFRRALALQRFTRRVAKLREPFLLVVGLGNTGRRITRSLDALGRRFVVVDADESHIATLEVEAYRADTPALVGEARDAGKLAVAGLGHRNCDGVLALTGDDEANLAVTMAAALLRPDLQVISRTSSRPMAERMQAFGEPVVVNPFDRFGDHLRILLRSPAAYQLMVWLTSAPGAELPPRHEPLARGRWLVCGYGTFGREITADLEAEGQEVTVIDLEGEARVDGPDLVGDGTEPGMLERAGLENAVGFVAATGSDTTNLSLVRAAGRIKPAAFLVARENRGASSSLYRAIGVDFVMVPGEVIAHETLARLSNPVLLRFLEQVPRQRDPWATMFVEKIVDRCGTRLPPLWRVYLTPEEAPALRGWLASGEASLGDLVRAPADRERPLDAVPLLLLRDGDTVLAPGDDVRLRPGDELLLVGWSTARRALDATLRDEATAEYVIGGRFVPSSWVWRRLSRQGVGGSGRTGSGVT